MTTSSQSFENAIIGFVRNCKKFKGVNKDDLLDDLMEGLESTGYFRKQDLYLLVNVIESMVDHSDTRRENRKKVVRISTGLICTGSKFCLHI